MYNSHLDADHEEYEGLYTPTQVLQILLRPLLAAILALLGLPVDFGKQILSDLSTSSALYLSSDSSQSHTKNRNFLISSSFGIFA